MRSTISSTASRDYEADAQPALDRRLLAPLARISIGARFRPPRSGTRWRAGAGRAPRPSARELLWRDYAQTVVVPVPRLSPSAATARSSDHLPWRALGAADLRAWQRGRTGYPIVDAGMRQLWATGWMHNRVRMIAASFLMKHLLIDWREGERWFWDTLVDADYANNGVNWQWVAGSGIDANLFARIMAPLANRRSSTRATISASGCRSLPDCPTPKSTIRADERPRRLSAPS